ncbi:unnamed protein product, partial [Symbiodinium sp. CCMP2456]
MDRLHSFFVALEYLNICEFTFGSGSLNCLSELEEWRHENRGLAVLLAANFQNRKKVYKLNNDKRKDFPRSRAHRDSQEPQAALKRPRSRSPPSTPVKNEAKARADRDRHRDPAVRDKPPPKLVQKEKVERDARVPEKALERPPGDFSVPSAVAQNASANDASALKPTAAALMQPPPWTRWSQIPRDPDVVRELGPWCLEVFAGSAHLTAQWRQYGLKTLPPIDVVQSEQVPEALDLLDAEFFAWLLLLCRMGAICFLHLGTPCSTFSIARDRPHGPMPLRSKELPLGLNVLDKAQQLKLFETNELVCRSISLFEAVVLAGGDASLENPLSSILWQVPQMQQLKVRLHLYNVDFDQCQFGGYQLKRGAAKPLLDVECEPGQAIEWSLQVIHPFTVHPALPPKILENIKLILVAENFFISGTAVLWLCYRILISNSLRRLLRGVPDYVDLQLGLCTHVALYDEFFAAIDCSDNELLHSLRSGFPIVGEIQRSGRWPPFNKPQKPVPVQDALARAWEMRAKI